MQSCVTRHNIGRWKTGNQFDKFAIKVLNGEQTVDHLPREYSRIAWYFLARGGSIIDHYAIKVSIHGHSQHLSQMVSQISRTYDFDRKFLEKRCGLSASLYGITFHPYYTQISVVTNADMILIISTYSVITKITTYNF